MLLRTGLVVCLVVLLAAACGGAPARQAAPPKLQRALAERWAGEADNIAALVQTKDGCPQAQQLASSLAAEVNADASQIPARLRSTAVAAATTLAGRISCKPKPPKKKGPPKHGHGPGQGDGG